MCDGTQNIKRYWYRYFFPVPNIFYTNTGNFFGTKFSVFFLVPNFSNTGSETCSGTNLFRYHQKYEKSPVPVRHTLDRSILLAEEMCISYPGWRYLKDKRKSDHIKHHSFHDWDNEYILTQWLRLISSDRSSYSDDGLLYIRGSDSSHFSRFSLSPLMLQVSLLVA